MPNPNLPVEILDYIADYLHDTNDALRNCCLISKSWISRTRKHLFANIKFHVVEDVRSWKKMFPDPSTSPARYAKALYFDPDVVLVADREVGGWIRGFSRVEHLEVVGLGAFFPRRPPHLAPFHGFSPVIKSLRVAVPILPLSQIFNLILSFPLLEDLDVMQTRAHGVWVDNGDIPGEDEMLTAAQLLRPPLFTGSLELYLMGGMEHFTRRLLSLPGSIHFRKLIWTWLYEENLPSMKALVEGCSHTLESLDIACDLRGMAILHLRLHR